MKKQKIDIAVAAVTFAAAAVTLFLLILLYGAVKPAAWFLKSLFAGFIVTAAAAVTIGAMYLFFRMRKRIKVHLPKLFGGFTAIFMALIFLTAFIGQTAYSASIVPASTLADAENEIVILMDSSVSAESDKNTVTGVASYIIDSLEDNTAAAMGFFTTEVDPSWQMTLMDNNGRAEMKQHLSESPSNGGTSLTKALTWAYGILEPDFKAGKNQMILLLTDGSSPIYPEVAQKIVDAGIIVNSIRPKGSEKLFLDDFVEFIGKTGGSDIEENGASSLKEIDSLVSVFGVPDEKKANRIGNIEFSDRFVLLDDARGEDAPAPTPVGILIRFAVLFILSLLFQTICFRRIDFISAAVALLAAIVACVLVTLFGAAYLILPAAMIISLADFTVIVFIQSEE